MTQRWPEVARVHGVTALPSVLNEEGCWQELHTKHTAQTGQQYWRGNTALEGVVVGVGMGVGLWVWGMGGVC